MASVPKTISETATDMADQAGEGLAAQIDTLRAEIAKAAASVREMGESGLDGAGQVLDSVGRQGRKAVEAARDNPLPVIAGLATVALLAALVFRRA